MAARRRAEAFRIASPRLEPDDAFVAQLADAARASRPTAPAGRHLPGLRVGLATAGVVGLSVGGAWAAGNLVEGEGQAPGPPPVTTSNPAISPAPTTADPTEPSVPISPSSHRVGPTSDRERGPGRGPGDRHGRPDRLGEPGRPDDLPGKGNAPGPDGPGKSHTHPQPGDHGKGDPQGTGGGRRSHHPR